MLSNQIISGDASIFHIGLLTHRDHEDRPRQPRETKAVLMPRCLATIRRHPDPIVCVYTFTGVLYSLIQPQVFREALVKKLNLSLEVEHNGTVSCLNVSTQSAKKEDEVQQVTSELLFNLSLISILPMCVTAAIGGGLIDLTRRKKVFMVISVLGQVISFVSLLVILHTSLGLYVQPVAYVTGSIIYSMGSSGLLATAVYSYISETTQTKNKTWRMIITETMLITGFALGVITGGPLADSQGLSAVALLGLSLTAFNIIYIVFILKRSSRVITEDAETRSLLNESNGKNSLTCCGSLVYGFKAGVKLFRGDRCFDRMALYYSVLSYGLFMLLEISKMSLIVLILRYYPFCFSNLDISLYQGEQMLLQISAIGLALVLVRRFGWHDDTLIIIGFASLTLSLLAVGLSFNMVTIYLGTRI